MNREEAVAKLVSSGIHKAIFKCSEFDAGICQLNCKYAYSFLLSHVYTNWGNFAELLVERTNKKYPFGYVKSTACRRNLTVKIISGASK